MEKITKIPIFDWFYRQGDIYVTVYTPPCKIPENLKKEKFQTFVLGETPCPNLTYNDDGINAPMRFGGNYFTCFFPWDGIVKMAGNSAVIEFKVSEEALDKIDKEPAPAKTTKKGTKKGKVVPKRGHLKVIK